MLRNVIARSCNLSADALTPETDLATLGVDSLVLTSLMAEIQAFCRIDLTWEQKIAVYEARSLKEIVDTLAPSPG